MSPKKWVSDDDDDDDDKKKKKKREEKGFWGRDERWWFIFNICEEIDERDMWRRRASE